MPHNGRSCCLNLKINLVGEVFLDEIRGACEQCDQAVGKPTAREQAERATKKFAKNANPITGMKQESDVQFLEYVVKALVDAPNDVKIVRTVDEMGVLLTLSLNSADMGKIIGRMGNTAKAIRTLLRVVGMKNNARVNLKINEPEGGVPREKATKTVDEAMADLKL